MTVLRIVDLPRGFPVIVVIAILALSACTTVGPTRGDVRSSEAAKTEASELSDRRETVVSDSPAALSDRSGVFQTAPFRNIPPDEQAMVTSPLQEPDERPFSPPNIGQLLGAEAERYAGDSLALVRAPLDWGRKDWEKAAAAGLIVGGLMFADRKIDSEAQRDRTPFTNRVSRATTGFGAEYGFAAAGGLVLSGIALKNTSLRDTGRDALEAAILAGLSSAVLKFATGRQRPSVSEEGNVFRPASGGNSFPSGHVTVAFAVASVVAARAQGWVVPSLAYATASLVAFDRVNDDRHFTSDVVAGALIGAVIGRFLVHRHQKLESHPESSLSVEIQPMAHGLTLRARF